MQKKSSSDFSKNTTKNSLVKSKLIKLLAKLSPATVKQFKTWHKQQGSPNRDAFLILKYILSYYPDFDSPKLAQEIAFKKIFGKIDYDYRRLMKAMSQVHIDLKEYLIQVELAEDDFLSDFLLAKVYTKYNLRHELNLLLDKKRALKPTISSPQTYYEQMQWEHLDFYADGQHKGDREERIINQAMTAFDLYFLGIKLKYACNIATSQILLNYTYQLQFSATIQAYCSANLATLPIFHQFYWLAWQLITNKKESDYQQLKQRFAQRYTSLKKEDRLILFTYLFNFTASKLRINEMSYLREAFELYQMSIDKEILVIDTLFVEGHFTNLINISCALKEFDWLDGVLTNQLSPVLKILPSSTLNLGFARIAFAKKDFLKCRAHLIPIDYSNFNYYKKAKTLQILCAYELKEPIQHLKANCKSFENYLRRNESKGKEDILYHLNFIGFVRQLIKIDPNKEKLLKDIHSIKTIYKPWLLEKINQLK